MNELEQEQLLNAYIDDELAPSQRAEVESMLAADPKSRRTVDALRTVHEAVASLPSRRLERDLADDVIAEAVRRQKADAPRPASALEEPQAAPSWRKRVFQPRNLVYPLCAVGMALAISLLFPSQEDLINRERVDNSETGTRQPTDEVSPSDVVDPIIEPPPRPLGYSVEGGHAPGVVALKSFTVQGSITHDAMMDRSFETVLGSAGIEPISRVSGPNPDQVTFGIKTDAPSLRSLAMSLTDHESIRIDWSPEDLQSFVRMGTEGETMSDESASIKFVFDIIE
jgi:hypothetical protein